MTWASREFKRVVKENQRTKLPINIKIAVGWILIISVVYFVVSCWFVYDDVYQGSRIVGALVVYLCFSGIALIYLRCKTKNQNPSQMYQDQIRNGLVLNVKQNMEQLHLPLDRAGESIREDIKKELEQLHEENQRHADFVKKIWTGIVCTPCAFLLALFFQGLFAKEALSTAEDLNAAINFLVQLFAVLLIGATLATVIYTLVRDGTKYVTGENQLRTCLDVLEEIRISELCDNTASADNSGQNTAGRTQNTAAGTP